MVFVNLVAIVDMLFHHCIPQAKESLYKSCLPLEQHDLYDEDLNRAIKKQNTIATTQRTVVSTWQDGPFLAMAIDFDLFAYKDRYWNNLRKISKRYSWSEAVSRLNYAFFMRHIEANDWQKMQSEGMARSITGACWADVLLDESRPIESTDLIERYGLVFDEYGLLDLSRCRSAIEERHKLESTTHILPTPSETHASSSAAAPDLGPPTLSESVAVTATSNLLPESSTQVSERASASLEDVILPDQPVTQPVVQQVVQAVAQSAAQSVIQPIAQAATPSVVRPVQSPVAQDPAQVGASPSPRRQLVHTPAAVPTISPQEPEDDRNESFQSRYIMRERAACPAPTRPSQTRSGTLSPQATTSASNKKRLRPTTEPLAEPLASSAKKRIRSTPCANPTPPRTIGREDVPDPARLDPALNTNAFLELADHDTRQRHQTLVQEAEQFLTVARGDANARRASRAAAREEYNLESQPFNMVLKLTKLGEYEVATEWKPSGLSLIDSISLDDPLRESADLLCLTLGEAKDLVSLRSHIAKPIVIRTGIPDFDAGWFLKQFEIHAGGPDGLINIQGGSPEEPVSTMKAKEVVQRVLVDMDEADPSSFQPVNCLDLRTLPSHEQEPSFMTHPRFSLLDVVRVQLQKKEGTFIPIGKQTWTPAPSSVVSRPNDMEQDLQFQLLSSQYTVSGFHEDVLNCTWVKCLAGVKAWFFESSDGTADTDDVPDSDDQQTASLCSPGVKLVILKPGDILYMPAGLLMRHAVVTLQGPCIMVGGQKLDSCSLPEQLAQMESLIDDPTRTNESVPCLQLPDVLDEILDYVMHGLDPNMINTNENRSRLRAALIDIRTRLSTRFGCQCTPDDSEGCQKDTCPCHQGSPSRRCTRWCKGHGDQHAHWQCFDESW